MFIEPGYNFDDVSKIGYPRSSKIKVSENKDYDVIVSVNDVTNKTLSHDSNYTVDVFMWPKFGNYSISMTSYHNLNFTRIWPEKPLFWGVVLVPVQ